MKKKINNSINNKGNERDEYQCPSCGEMVDVEEFAENGGICKTCNSFDDE